MTNTHSYAAYVLKQKGWKILRGGEQILTQEYPYTFPKLETRIRKSTDYVREMESEQIKILRELDDLAVIGFKILRYSATGVNFRGQKLGYKLVRENYYSDNICDNMPVEHFVEYDVVNKAIRLVGKNAESPTNSGKGEWLSLQFTDEPTIREVKRNPFDLGYSYQRAEKYMRKKNPTIKDDSYLVIPETVVGISDEGHIVCEQMIKSTDMPSRIIYGKKGQGKSLFEHNFEDQDFYKQKVSCCNVNDVKPETMTRCMPWDKCDFLDVLHKFGEETIPLPAVYLNPTTSHEYLKIYPNEIGFDVSIPYRALLRDENLVLHNKVWEMRKSGAFLDWKQLIKKDGVIRNDGILYAEGMQDIARILEKEVKEKSKREKILLILSDIYNSMMTEKSSKVAAKWIISNGDNELPLSPWNACMHSGLFPYLNTSGIRSEFWFALWLRYAISDILDYAKLYRVPVMMYLDEIAHILKDKATREIVEQAIRECRMSKVGITMVCHFFGDMPEAISMHADYEYVFNTTDKELISHLKARRHLSLSQAKDISFLKQFQCFAFGDFILYDTDGRVFSNNGRPVKITRIKFPSSRHYGG